MCVCLIIFVVGLTFTRYPIPIEFGRWRKHADGHYLIRKRRIKISRYIENEKKRLS